MNPRKIQSALGSRQRREILIFKPNCYIYKYIYIERERERDTCENAYHILRYLIRRVYTYIYMISYSYRTISFLTQDDLEHPKSYIAISEPRNSYIAIGQHANKLYSDLWTKQKSYSVLETYEKLDSELGTQEKLYSDLWNQANHKAIWRMDKVI